MAISQTNEGPRTRIINSILVYLILTLAFSTFFYREVLLHSMAYRGGLLVFGLMWCPGIAGLLTRFLFQRNLRGEGFGWGRTRYQIASYLIPLAYAAAVYLPVWFAGYFTGHGRILTEFGELHPHIPSWAQLPAYFVYLGTVAFLGSCLAALGEELGWRGFLVPELAKLMPFPRVALLSGVIWALWHYPLLFFGGYSGAGPRWYSAACFTVMVIGISFVFAWMRLKSGSLWTGVILHGSHNLFIQVFFDQQTRHARLTDLWTTEFGAGLALAGIVVAIIFYRKRGELPALPALTGAADSSSPA
jgi:membrane protease YdiL (CAAX protease family)